MITVSAVVVAFGQQPELAACLDALSASTGVELEVVVVDNGDLTGVVAGLHETPALRVVRPGRNLGFAEGCNAGVAVTSGGVVALVNPDVVVAPDALARLAAALLDPGVGIVTASIRLADDPSRMNSAGNPVHFSGLAWAGGHGEPIGAHGAPATVASASGACCAMTRRTWDALGGFDADYFAYHEDVELSLRCWLTGRRVVYVPDARATHRYEFGRNARKNELLERNRLLTVLRVYAPRTLVLLAPALLAVEAMIVVLAIRQGWLRAKLAGYRWLWRNRGRVLAGRRAVQGLRCRPDREVARVLTGDLHPTNVDPIPGLRLVSAALAGYWCVVRRFL